MNYITTTFEISDYTNGIIQNTIGLTSGSVGSIDFNNIVSLDGVFRYSIPVLVSSTGYVEISAMNYVAKTAIFKENNFIIGCEDGKKTSLTKFIPQYYRDNPNGTESEYFQFVKVFEDYLNTLYYNIENSCNISTLEKIKKLGDFRNIDKIDVNYIYQYANMLGYDVGINKSEIGKFVNTSGTYSDTFENYQEKCLRFVVGNLPNWYSIKTTRNAVRTMLLSFGIIGDLIENYTLDYKNYWKQNRTVAGQYVDESISKEWYPTPHVSVGIDLKNSDHSKIYSDTTKHIINAMESIRPANVVIESLQGYYSTDENNSARSINLSVSFKSSKSINVTRLQQINT